MSGDWDKIKDLVFNSQGQTRGPIITRQTFEECSLPLSYYGRTLKTWVEAKEDHVDLEVAQFIRNYALNIEQICKDLDGRQIGLVLGGPNGTGKTGLAVIVAVQWLKYARRQYLPGDINEEGGWVNPAKRCRLMRITDLYAMLRQGMGTGYSQISFQEVWEETKRLGCLIIDDLGRDVLDKSDDIRLFLMDLIKTRLANNRLTIITTNLSGEHLHGLFQATGFDVLREKSVFLSVKSRLRKHNE